DLGRRLARGPLDVRGALRVVRSAAEALAVAHRRGVVHRDLKPSNIFLRDGRLDRPVLLDFGIARPMRGVTKITATGAVIGTPDYMAPEQARGDEIGPAADVFALGSVLYECLAGAPPFAAEHIATVLAKILFDDAPSIEALRPGLPPA